MLTHWQASPRCSPWPSRYSSLLVVVVVFHCLMMISSSSLVVCMSHLVLMWQNSLRISIHSHWIYWLSLTNLFDFFYFDFLFCSFFLDSVFHWNLLIFCAHFSSLDPQHTVWIFILSCIDQLSARLIFFLPMQCFLDKFPVKVFLVMFPDNVFLICFP